MFARINSMGLLGVDGFMVDVEADLSQGLPGFDVVGLPGAAVKESRDRVRAAMKNSGFAYPVSRITVNLAPADIRKEGSVYDLLSCSPCTGPAAAECAGGRQRFRRGTVPDRGRPRCPRCAPPWSSPPGIMG